MSDADASSMPADMVRVRDQLDSARGYDVVVDRAFDPMGSPKNRAEFGSEDAEVQRELADGELKPEDVHRPKKQYDTVGGLKRRHDGTIPHGLAHSEKAEHDREHVSRYEITEEEDDTVHPHRWKRAMLEAAGHEKPAGEVDSSVSSKDSDTEILAPSDPSVRPEVPSHWPGHPELPGFYAVDPVVNNLEEHAPKSQHKSAPPHNPKRKPEPKMHSPTNPEQLLKTWLGEKPHYDPLKVPVESEFAPGVHEPGDLVPEELRSGGEGAAGSLQPEQHVVSSAL